MKTLFRPALLVALPFGMFAAQPWQELVLPTVAEAAAAFPSPPKEYGAIHWATGFPPARERIVADIENTAANGGTGSLTEANATAPSFPKDGSCTVTWRC